MAGTSKALLNISGESRHICLVRDLRGNAFTFSQLRIMFAMGFSYMAFIIVRWIISMLNNWRIFIIMGVEFC